jgi:hypothetical protein
MYNVYMYSAEYTLKMHIGHQVDIYAQITVSLRLQKLVLCYFHVETNFLFFTPSTSSFSDFFASSFDQKLEFYKNNLQPGNQSLDMSLPATGSISPSSQQCKTTVLFMVLHGGKCESQSQYLASQGYLGASSFLMRVSQYM